MTVFVRRSLARRVRASLPLPMAAVALLHLLAAPAAAQSTTARLGLEGPVATVREYREFPGSIDRQLVRQWTFASGRSPRTGWPSRA
jgi:hypothetical protein